MEEVFFVFERTHMIFSFLERVMPKQIWNHHLGVVHIFTEGKVCGDINASVAISV